MWTIFCLRCAVLRCDTQCGQWTILCCVVSRCDVIRSVDRTIFCCVALCRDVICSDAQCGLFSVALRSVALRCDAQYGLFSVALRGCAVLPVRLCSVIRGMHYFLLRCTMLHCTALRSVA